MRDALRGKWFARRIENLAGAGTPDVVWASGVSGVLELKVAVGNRVRFRPGQIPWMLAWIEHGGRGHVVVWHRERIKVFDGARALELHQNGVVKTPHVECDVDWPAVLGILKGGR
jgi:hypothetical protein